MFACRAAGRLGQRMKKLLPWSMTVGRVLFAPALLWAAFRRASPWVIAGLIAAEVVLDIFDGMVARRLGMATALLRRMDSLVDTVFYLAVLYCAWELHRPALRERWGWFLGLVGCEAARYVFDYVKFRREAAYHMWSSKAWGLLLGAAVIALLAFHTAGWLLTAALITGMLCDVEGLLISVLLHESVEDVPHVFRAVQLRREQEAQRKTRALAAVAN